MGRGTGNRQGELAVERAQGLLATALSGSGGAAALSVLAARPLGTLWAGYGTITEVETDGEDAQTLIVKEVHPPASSGVSHERKLRSYQVEAAFYERLGPRLPADAACHVPRCLGVVSTLHSAGDSMHGSSGDSGKMQLVMSDLRADFPRSCGSLDEAHTKAALSWLAAFHAACWGADAAALGLWGEGCYWHLQTRLEELEEIGGEWRALQAAAHELDRRLQQTPWRTLCHGDFKSANLQFSDSRSSPVCAAVDFQYCGGGSGLKDVAYLLASSASPSLLQGGGEEALLRFYHAELIERLRALAASGSGNGGAPVGCPSKAAQAVESYTFEALQADWRLAVCDYVRFMAGWGFWGNSSWASARARECLTQLDLA